MTIEEINKELKDLEKDRSGIVALVNELKVRYKEKGEKMMSLIKQKEEIKLEEKRKKERYDSWDTISK